MRLLFVTQSLDAEHPALAQTLDLVVALAERTDELVVLAQSVGRHPDLPANVRVRVFGAHRRSLRGGRFLRALVSELARRPDAVIAHMVPLYVLLAAPLAKPLRVPILLWYTHWHAGRQLRVATLLVDVVLSVSNGSFPLRTPKLVATGHAIDVETFVPGQAREDGPLRLLALGRTARWKGYETMLDSLERAAAAGLDAELEIRGPELTDDERAHAAELRRPGRRFRHAPRPGQDRASAPARLSSRRCSTAPTRSSARRSRAPARRSTRWSTRPPLARCRCLRATRRCSEFLADLPLELSFPPRDAAALAERIVALAAAGPEARAQTGAELRRRVVDGHSVGSWADAVAETVARLTRE